MFNEANSYHMTHHIISVHVHMCGSAHMDSLNLSQSMKAKINYFFSRETIKHY